MSTQQIRVTLTGDSTGLEAAGSRGTRTLDNLVRSSGNAQRSLTQLSGSTAANTRQMAMLAPQVTDVVTSLAGGQNPMLVLIQQGGQLRDVFGGFRPALSAVASLFSATAVVGGALAGTVGLLAKAFLDGQAQSERFRDAMALTGGAAGISEGQFNALTERVTQASNATASGAREIAEGLLSSGQLGGQALEVISTAAARVADVSGQSAKDVIRDFSDMARGAGDWALKHNEAWNFITAAQLRGIRAMEDAGDAQGAMIKVGELVIKHLEEQRTNLGYAERAINAVKQAWSSMWDAALGIGRAKTTQDQLAEVSTQLERARRVAAEGVITGSGAPRTGQAEVARLELVAQNLREQIKLERQVGTVRADNAQREKEQIKKDEAERKVKPKKPKSQESQDAEYQRMVRETLANRPPRLAEIEAQGYEQIAQYERDQLLASARASQQKTKQQERERERAIDQARDLGEQLINETAGTNARLLTDDAARADAQLEIERRTIQQRIATLAAAGADVRSLEDSLADYMVARRAEAVDQLKPQWQRMLEGWRDTHRLMRDSLDSFQTSWLQSGEQAWLEFARTGKLSARDLIDTVLVEMARLQFRQNVAPWLSTLGSSLFGALTGSSAGAAAGSTAGTVSGGSGIKFNARGNVYGGAPGLSSYSGTVVNRPTMFAFARGAGVMGEAGYEGIFPLKRNSRGQLGVMASDAGQQPAQVINNITIKDAPPGTTKTTSRNASGGMDIELQIGRIAVNAIGSDVAQGGPASQMISQAFGLSRRTRARS
jgi:lambda family phage tail tape measure protein